MGIQEMTLSQGGPAPQVDVLIGNANLASYTIAMVPPNMDVSQAQSFFNAQTPQQVAASHPLPAGWATRDGWFVIIVGGIGAASDPPVFSVQSTLSQVANSTPMTTTIMESDSAAQFVSSIKLSIKP